MATSASTFCERVMAECVTPFVNRLVNGELEGIASRCVITIQAPAGYGKSTLLRRIKDGVERWHGDKVVVHLISYKDEHLTRLPHEAPPAIAEHYPVISLDYPRPTLVQRISVFSADDSAPAFIDGLRTAPKRVLVLVDDFDDMFKCKNESDGQRAARETLQQIRCLDHEQTTGRFGMIVMGAPPLLRLMYEREVPDVCFPDSDGLIQ